MALILDTGVVFASLDRDSDQHVACHDLIRDANEVLVLPSPVLPEIDYLVGTRLGSAVMLAFLRDVQGGAFTVADPTPTDYDRAIDVLDRYADLEVGFVDAMTLAIVERMNEPKLATLDHQHFSVLRPRHVDALELVPA